MYGNNTVTGVLLLASTLPVTRKKGRYRVGPRKES